MGKGWRAELSQTHCTRCTNVRTRTRAADEVENSKVSRGDGWADSKMCVVFMYARVCRSSCALEDWQIRAKAGADLSRLQPRRMSRPAYRMGGRSLSVIVKIRPGMLGLETDIWKREAADPSANRPCVTRVA